MTFSEDQKCFNELYDFDDETGILGHHKQMFGNSEDCSSENQLESGSDNIKIMFYELIKMICDFDNQNRNSLRQIHKIDGFQHLSNKLFLQKMKNLRKDNISVYLFFNCIFDNFLLESTDFLKCYLSFAQCWNGNN